MTKKPLAFATWLAYHRERCGIARFYIRVEDTPELSTLLATPPWDECVEAIYSHGQRDYFQQMDRQDAHISSILQDARANGIEYLLHIDDDELLYCPSGLNTLYAAFVRAPPDAADLHVCNLEALLPRAEVIDPFREAVAFRHRSHDFCAYGNGKSFGKLSAADLRPAGPHHFARGWNSAGSKTAGTHDLPPSTAVVLHYESGNIDAWRRKYSDLATRHAGSEHVSHRAPSSFYAESMAAMAEVLAANRAGDAARVAQADAAAVALFLKWKSLPLQLAASTLQGPLPRPEAHPIVLKEVGITILDVFAQPVIGPPPLLKPSSKAATAAAAGPVDVTDEGAARAAAAVPEGLLCACRDGSGGDLSELWRFADIDLTKHGDALNRAAGSEAAGELLASPKRLEEVARAAKLPIGLRLKLKSAAMSVREAAGPRSPPPSPPPSPPLSPPPSPPPSPPSATTDTAQLKKQGNDAFKAGRNAEAIDRYTRAIDLWVEPAERAVLYTNRSAARLKLGEAAKALADAEKALTFNPTYAKAHFRAASALRLLKRPSEAEDRLQCVLALAPNDTAAKQLLEELREEGAKKDAIPPMPPPPPPSQEATTGMRDHDVAVAVAPPMAPPPQQPPPTKQVNSGNTSSSTTASQESRRDVVWALRDAGDGLGASTAHVVALTPDQAKAEQVEHEAAVLAQVPPGTRVCLACLKSRAELNGTFAKVIGLPRADGRIPIQTETDVGTATTSSKLWVRRDNMDPVDASGHSPYELPKKSSIKPEGRGYAYDASKPKQQPQKQAKLPPPATFASSSEVAKPAAASTAAAAALVRVTEIEGRGRGVIATKRIPAGTLLTELSGPAFSACPLPSQRMTRCALCFDELRGPRKTPDESLLRPFPQSGQPAIRKASPSCEYVYYCSSHCLEADKSQRQRQCKHLKSADGPLRGLEGASGSLGRLGVLLLAGRCLWRRHEEGEVDRAATEPLAATAQCDAAFFDLLHPGPTHEADDELAKLAESLDGFLPPGATAANVTALLGAFRVNMHLIEETSTATIPPASVQGVLGAGCYPRTALINHSCKPNAVLSYEGSRVRVRTIREIQAEEEVLVSYVDLCQPTEVRKERLRYGYGFECCCERCDVNLSADQDDAMLDLAVDDETAVEAAHGEGEAAVECSACLLEYVAACLQHVPNHPRLSIERYRHARLEAAWGSVEEASLLAAKVIESLKVSHGAEHALTKEVSTWAQDVKVRGELEVDLSEQNIFRDPDGCETKSRNTAKRGMEEPPRGPEPLHAF